MSKDSGESHEVECSRRAVKKDASGILGALLCWLLFAPAIASARENLRYDAERPLLSLHGDTRKNREEDLDSVLRATFANEEATAPKALVLYVHGRGHEPKKSFSESVWRAITRSKNTILPKIEQHGVHVLGVNWRSAPSLLQPFCSRPIDRAEQAGALLVRTVTAMQKHRELNPELWKERKVVLLVHSMGSFVLRSALSIPNAAESFQHLFDVVVISQSDVPRQNHAEWISALPRDRTVVLTNPNDRVLLASTKCDRPGRANTGLRLGTLDLGSAGLDLSDHAYYVQLEVGDRHRVFTKSATAANPAACELMRGLLNGRLPTYRPEWAVKTHPRAYFIPRSADPKSTCAAGALVDDDADD